MRQITDHGIGFAREIIMPDDEILELLDRYAVVTFWGDTLISMPVGASSIGGSPDVVMSSLRRWLEQAVNEIEGE